MSNLKKQFMIWVTDEQHAWLKKTASEHGKTMSQYIRERLGLDLDAFKSWVPSGHFTQQAIRQRSEARKVQDALQALARRRGMQ